MSYLKIAKVNVTENKNTQNSDSKKNDNNDDKNNQQINYKSDVRENKKNSDNIRNILIEGLTCNNFITQEGFMYFKGLFKYCSYEEAKEINPDIFKYDLTKNNTSKVERLRPVNVSKIDSNEKLLNFIKSVKETEFKDIDTINFMNYKFFTSQQDSALCAYNTCLYKDMFIESKQMYETLVTNNFNFNINIVINGSPIVESMLINGDGRMREKINSITKNKAYSIEMIRLNQPDYIETIKKLPENVINGFKSFTDRIDTIDFSTIDSKILKTLIDRNIIKYYLTSDDVFIQLSKRPESDNEIISNIIDIYLNYESLFEKDENNVYNHIDILSKQKEMINHRRNKIKEQYTVTVPRHIKRIYIDKVC